MDLATVAYVLKIIAAILAAVWSLIVLYDVVVADAGARKIATHAIYALLSLGAVIFLALHSPD